MPETTNAPVVPRQHVMTWQEALARLKVLDVDKLGHRVYGVPRGGMCLATLLAHATTTHVPSQADIILDDIIDSGQTQRNYRNKYPQARFVAIVDKTTDGYTSKHVTLPELWRAAAAGGESIPEDPHTFPVDKDMGWITFPWEIDGKGDPETAEGRIAAQDSVIRLLQFMGENPLRQGLKDTPDRVLRMYQELTSGYGENPTAHLKAAFDSECDEMVVVRGIRFTSLCEHHLLPFTGDVAIGYLPANGRVVGLSKLVRVVDTLAKRLQIQERLTGEIAQTIMGLAGGLHPLGVGVVVQARHSCMGCRGVKRPESEAVTSAMLGVFREKPEVRSEFLSLVRDK